MGHVFLDIFYLEVLVPELSSVDRLAASAVEVGEVAALAHELGNHAMEDRSLKMLNINDSERH